ncbi:MAG: hypothetical protein B7Y41_08060 [Hydrogenophilales bacterium 28-61-23]|nr:MAG: hypothetical protein B7Y41_08060 [Hydrogenophilales bacterium 28-61-23]
MRERILEIINYVTEAHRKFKHFAELTGINAQKWQNLGQGKQRANDEMIEAVGKAFPQYAYWLVTGKTDEAHGHTSPVLERIQNDLRTAGRDAA